MSVQIATRLKDVLWSLRTMYHIGADLDRVIPFIALNQRLNKEQLDALFFAYPIRTPADFRATLIARVEKIVRDYWVFATSKKGYPTVLRGILFLEGVARAGIEGCIIVPDNIVGFHLELKKPN